MVALKKLGSVLLTCQEWRCVALNSTSGPLKLDYWPSQEYMDNFQKLNLKITITHDSPKDPPGELWDLYGLPKLDSFTLLLTGATKLPHVSYAAARRQLRHLVVTNAAFQPLESAHTPQGNQQPPRWQSYSSLGNLKRLIEMKLLSCGDLRYFPVHLSSLRFLQTLSFEGCRNLLELPESIGELRWLRHLSLKGCTSLQSLPSKLVQLSRRISLNLDYVYPDTRLYQRGIEFHSDLKDTSTLINQIGTFQQLSLQGWQWCDTRGFHYYLGIFPTLLRLNLGQFTRLSFLPENVGQLTTLRSLNLQYCRQLQCFPVGLSRLVNLRRLNLEGCHSIHHISLLGLTNLQDIRLNGCSNIEAVQGLASYIARPFGA